MGSFAQFAAAGEVRRVTWVCGDQRVLVEETVDTIRTQLAPADIDYVTLSHQPAFDRQVWSAANQYPLNPGANRLVLVRDAEKLTRWEQLELWMGRTRQLPGVYLVFVSNETDLPYVMTGGKKDGLKPHVAAIKAPRGHVVRCTMPNEVDAVAWVRRRARLDDETARHLLTRSGGNLAAVSAVCAKLALFDGNAGRSTIDALCQERPVESFVDCLLAVDKKAALRCIADLLEADYAKTISLLDSRLDMLQVLNKVQAAGQGFRDVPSINPYLVRQYMPIAKHYDGRRCVYRRRVLAVIDDALRSGAREGVWEALVALW